MILDGSLAPQTEMRLTRVSDGAVQFSTVVDDDERITMIGDAGTAFLTGDDVRAVDVTNWAPSGSTPTRSCSRSSRCQVAAQQCMMSAAVSFTNSTMPEPLRDLPHLADKIKWLSAFGRQSTQAR